PINSGKKPSPAAVNFVADAAPASAAVAPSAITWFNVNKQLGPIKFDRIGVEYASGTLSFAMDAALSLGPATLSMQGLSMGSELKQFAPVFGLDGFSIDISSGGFQLSGGFLKAIMPDGAKGYFGMLIIKAGPLSLRAFGGDVPAHEA